MMNNNLCVVMLCKGEWFVVEGWPETVVDIYIDANLLAEWLDGRDVFLRYGDEDATVMRCPSGPTAQELLGMVPFEHQIALAS